MHFTQIDLFLKKYQRWIPILFFILGFLFDMLMLSRIDDLHVILQQAVYLIISSVLIGVELVEETRAISAPRILNKAWKYREAFLHFLLGTLLNSYVIFYFKSASAWTSLFFIALLIVLLTLNEFKRFGKSQTQVHVAFLSLCFISYFISLAPMVLGFIGVIPFLCAVLWAVAVFYVYYRIMRQKLKSNPSFLKTHMFYPYFAIQIIFLVLYFLNAIPPVPLSVKYMGIFHDAKKVNGGYELTYTRTAWKFWQNGDQTFLARPGDIIHCYLQIFSPTRFKDQLQIRWLFWDDKRGWQSSDAIELPVIGGREEGYRAVMKKSNFQPGLWRVQAETKTGLEIGRIEFTVLEDKNLETRELHVIQKD